MITMKKRTLALLLVLTMLVAVLSGCGSSSNASAPAPAAEAPAAEAPASKNNPAEDPNVTLSYTWWGNQVRAERTTKVVEMFMTANSNVTINPEFTDGGSYEDLVKTRSAGGALPNILQTDWYWVPEWAEAGLLIPLDPYVEAGILDISDCDPNTIAAGTVDGSLYALSMGNNARSMFYNATLLDSLGLSISREPTWDEFIELGKTIYEQTGVQTSLCWSISYAELLRSVVRGYGYEFYTDDYSSLGFDETVAVKCYELLAELGQQDWVQDPAEYAAVTGVEVDPITTGKTWNSFFTSNMGVGLQAAAGDDISLDLCATPIYADCVRQPCNVQPSQLTGLGNIGSDADKEASAAFLSYIINDVDANKVLLMERGVSMNAKVCEALADDLAPISVRIADYVTYISEHGAPAPALEPGCSQQIFDVDKDMRAAVLFGSMTAEEAAAQFVAQANAILAEYAG